MTDTLMEVFQRDEHNVEVSIQALRHYGVWNLFDRVPSLFEVLLREVEQFFSLSPRDHFARTPANGARDSTCLRPSGNHVSGWRCDDSGRASEMSR